jgi:hypothetical protein
MRRDVYAMPTECGLRHQVMATSKTLAPERRWLWKDGQIPLETGEFSDYCILIGYPETLPNVS